MKNRNGKKDYNSREHQETFTGPELFTPEPSKGTDVSVAAVPRSSTWGKIFDFENEGLTENNYQAPITTMNDTMGKAIRKGKPARISPSLHG